MTNTLFLGLEAAVEDTVAVDVGGVAGWTTGFVDSWNMQK